MTIKTQLHFAGDGSRSDLDNVRAALRRDLRVRQREDLTRMVAASLAARAEGRRVYGDMFIRPALDSAVRDQLTALAPTIDASAPRPARDIEAVTAVARPPRAA
jgi:hypothetical protein